MSSLAEFQDRIRAAAAAGTPLAIQGGGSKSFYAEPPHGEPLDVRGHSGIVSYEPSELVVTVPAETAGTATGSTTR